MIISITELKGVLKAIFKQENIKKLSDDDIILTISEAIYKSYEYKDNIKVLNNKDYAKYKYVLTAKGQLLYLFVGG